MKGKIIMYIIIILLFNWFQSFQNKYIDGQTKVWRLYIIVFFYKYLPYIQPVNKINYSEQLKYFSTISAV